MRRQAVGLDRAELKREKDIAGAVGNIERRTAKHPDRTRVGQARTGHEVHKHFGGRLVEPDQRDPIVGCNRQLLDAQRPQRAILFGNG